MTLIKLAANAFTKRFTTGALSPEALGRIRSAGMIRNGEKIVEGFNKGTEGYLKKKNVDVKTTGLMNKAIALTGGGYAATGSPEYKMSVLHINDSKLKYLSPMHSIFTPTKNKTAHALAFKHEAHEVSEVGKGNFAKIYSPLTDKERKSSSDLLSSIQNNTGIGGRLLNYNHDLVKHVKGQYEKLLPQIIQNDVGKAVGAHHNLAVLGKESNDVRTLKGLYGVDTSRIENLRHNKTQEPKLLQRITGKRYGVDPFTKEDLNKLRTAKHDFSLNTPEFGGSGVIPTSGFLAR